jgi:hypothetical protein
MTSIFTVLLVGVLRSHLSRVRFLVDTYCGIYAESQNCKDRRDSRCYVTDLQTRPLLGNDRKDTHAISREHYIDFSPFAEMRQLA